MAAFSSIFQQHPFILDSPLFFPNDPLSVFDQSSTSTTIDSFSELTNHNHNHDDITPKVYNVNRKRKSKEERKEHKKRKMRSEEKKAEGYIHVRARRGQATDRHSLAERVRREKISERMKVLQAIVPGCEKVSGKAMVLDEIINYVRFLQNQVEFLSMKLTSMNPMFYNFGMDLESFLVSPEDQTGKHELWEMEVDEFRQNNNNNKTSEFQQDNSLFCFH